MQHRDGALAVVRQEARHAAQEELGQAPPGEGGDDLSGGRGREGGGGREGVGGWERMGGWEGDLVTSLVGKAR